MSTAVATLGDLALDQVSRLDNRSRRTNVFVQIANIIPDLAGWLVIRQFSSMSKQLAEQAVWFRGARASLVDDVDADLIDADLVLQPRMEHTILSIQRLRRNTLDLASRFDARPNKSEFARKLLVTLQGVASASAELYEEANAFKCTLLEHDADRAPRHDGWIANSPEEVRHLLAKI